MRPAALTLERSESRRQVAADGKLTRRSVPSYPHLTKRGLVGLSGIAAVELDATDFLNMRLNGTTAGGTKVVEVKPH